MLLGLSLCLLQRFQFVGGSADRILQRTLLLRKEFCIGRVQFEETVHILQLALGVSDRGINAFQGFFQTCSVAPDFHCYAFDASGHAVRLLPLEIIEILLPGDPNGILLAVLVVVVPFLRPDIQNHADGQEIEVR